MFNPPYNVDSHLTGTRYNIYVYCICISMSAYLSTYIPVHLSVYISFIYI